MKAGMNKILKPDGRALVVAMDHGRDWGPLPGIEKPGETIEKLIDAGIDGVFTTYGIAKQFGHLMAGRVSLIVRTDGYASAYREKWLEYASWQRLFSVEDALRVGADGILVMYFMGNESESPSLRVLAEYVSEADRLGVPIAVETMPCPSPNIPDTYDTKVIATAARIAMEHGADMVKCYYNGRADFSYVTETVPVPVLIAGGPVTETRLDALRMVSNAVKAGVRGVFFGQNIWRSPDPVGMARALSAIIHDDMAPEAAAEQFLAEAAVK
ncbi:MAG: fructose-bisphosphate aldolase [Anaerolineae bacterium]|nr:fructose-bisphosphate aldolase [Anaerolineae bacterium]